MFLILLFTSLLSISNSESLDPYDISWADSDLSTPDRSEDDIRQEELDIYNSYKGPSNGFVNTGVVLFPFYTNADTRSTAFGVDAMYYFRRSKEPPYSKPSYIRGVIAAGRENYTDLELMFNNYWKKEYHNLYAAVGLERRYAYYFKPFQQDPVFLGNYRAMDSRIELVYRQKFSALSYMGIKAEFRNYDMHSKDPGANFNPNSVLGLNGGSAVGLGWLWSSMEPGGLFSMNRGFDFDISSMIYSQYLGGGFDFGVHKIDLRENIFITHSHIIMLKFFGRFITGEPPYFGLSSVGEIFKAYPDDMYKDRHLIAINGEYRMLLVSVLILRGFLGIGYHAPSISKFRMNEYLPCYGGGMSFILNRALGINAGFEYVAGRGTKGIFFGIGENY